MALAIRFSNEVEPKGQHHKWLACLTTPRSVAIKMLYASSSVLHLQFVISFSISLPWNCCAVTMSQGSGIDLDRKTAVWWGFRHIRNPALLGESMYSFAPGNRRCAYHLHLSLIEYIAKWRQSYITHNDKTRQLKPKQRLFLECWIYCLAFNSQQPLQYWPSHR